MNKILLVIFTIILPIKVFCQNESLIDSLNIVANKYYEQGNYTEAIRTCSSMINAYQKMGKNDEAFALAKKTVDSYSDISGDIYGTVTYQLTSMCVKRGDINSVIEYGKKALDAFGAPSINNLDFYFATCNSMINAYQKMGKDDEAFALAKKAVDSCSGRCGDIYGFVVHQLASMYEKQGDINSAIELNQKAIDALSSPSIGNSGLYFATCCSLIKACQKMARYEETIECANKIEQILPGTKNKYYAMIFTAISEFYVHLEDWDSSIKYGMKALEGFGEGNDDNRNSHYSAYNQISNAYLHLGDKVKSMRYAEEALNYVEQVSGLNSTLYATSLNNIATSKTLLGNNEEALIYSKRAVKAREKAGEMGLYVGELCNLADCYRAIRDYPSMEREASLAVQIACDSLGTDTTYYYQALSSLANAKHFTGDNKEAIKLAEKVKAWRLSHKGEENIGYAMTLYNLSVYHFSDSKIEDAIRLCTEALEIFKKVDYTQDSPIMCMESLLIYYYALNKLDNIRDITPDVFSKCSDKIIKSFVDLAGKERDSYWRKYQDWYEQSLHKYVYAMPQETLVTTGYDGILLSKGLLLNSEIEFSKLILESSDSTILTKYNDMRLLRRKINKLKERQADLRSFGIDSLENEVKEIEVMLLDSCKAYGNYTENLKITWNQVQEKLTDKDIAVEFVSFPLNADSTMYIAYVLKKGWECPKIIKLFEEKELKSVLKREFMYRTDTISRLVWKPLDDVMQGVKNVYFAPSGELYNVAIESVPTHEDGGKTLISEHGRNYYRLSSTRELALIKDKSSWNEAVVYGGLDYGMSVDEMSRDASKYPRARSNSATTDFDSAEKGLDRFNPNALDTLHSLPGTLNEAKAITKNLERLSVKTLQFTDSLGTETSFKDLHGRKKNIIHIGTHGFFNDRRKEYRNDDLQLLGTDLQSKVVEDDALTRSGLYFAGANNVRLNGYTAIPDSIDDGILKASEIAQLDLRSLDMVVLSACQTGLGEITGDGVFGLQRGFKKAGAQTIIMSLWSVDDEATKDFMTEFFKNIEIDGEKHPTNKHEAFKKAQNRLRANRSKYPEDPDCWAAFVMLDGLD